MIGHRKKIYGIFTIMLWVICSFSIPGMALEVETHRAINEYIADKNVVLNGFSLHQYLQSQLGLQNGSEEYFNNKKVFKWLGDGGEFEDKPSGCVPYWRSRNHFHNPIDNSGFSGWWNTGIISGMSAISWINQPVNTQSCGYYSWNDARKYYYAALTATDKAVRENNFADTFRALGQSMHLVQDMSVPEHTRNDGHYFFFDYEVWAKSLKVSDYSLKLFTPNDSFPLTINNLFDTNQYNGANPDITTQAAIGLAEYSNANFLSPEHIFKGFDYPTYIGMTAKIETDPTTGKKKVYLSKTGNGENIDYLARTNSLFNYLPVDYKRYGLTLDDEKVYKNYAEKLIPRAIGYSSQVLNYFFRGQLDATLGDGNIKIKNASAETIAADNAENNKFYLYYDNSDGVRTLVTSAQANTLTPNGDPQTINFTLPEGETVKSYMLVYSGQLGAEPKAVIGKFIPADSAFAVFTISAPGKNSIVVVYDIKNEKFLFTARSATDVDYVAWLTTVKEPSSSVNMFGSFYDDYQPPYKLRPDLVDAPPHYYHSWINDEWGFPKTRYATVIGESPDSPHYYTGYRTEEFYSASTNLFADCFAVAVNPGGIAYTVRELVPAVASDNAHDVCQVRFPPPAYVGADALDVIRKTTSQEDWTFWGEFGQIGAKAAGGIVMAGDNSNIPGTDVVSLKTSGHSSFVMEGKKCDDGFAMVTFIGFQGVEITVVLYDDAYIEHAAYLPREIFVQAAATSLKTGEKWYEKTTNTSLNAELVAAAELFFSVNGYAADQYERDLGIAISLQVPK